MEKYNRRIGIHDRYKTNYDNNIHTTEIVVVLWGQINLPPLKLIHSILKRDLHRPQKGFCISF